MATIVRNSDPEIQQDVLRELRWDSRVEETEVGVEVDLGIVTLTGTVSSWAKKVAAQEAAHRVAGVLDVANDIEVRSPDAPGRTDTEIAQAVRSTLEWDVFVPHEHIRSTVANGGVTLEGSVEYWAQREDAERAIRNLAGVSYVSNKIEIKPGRLAPEQVRQSIEGALERHAERDARQIKVEIHGGRVTLSGTVHSWGERRVIIGVARGTAGVKEVDDRLIIAPFTR